MTLAELVINLSANTAGLQRDFQKAHSMAQSAARQIKSALGFVVPALSVGFIVREMSELVGAAERAGSEIYRLGRISGMGARELSGLRMIVKEEGESLEALSGILARTGKNITAGLLDPVSTAGELLAQLFSKTEIESLRLAPVSERIESLARRIFGLADAQQMNYVASAFFGKGWMENVETLQRLAKEGFEPAIVKAKELGQYIDEEAAAQADAYGDACNRLRASWEGLAQTASLKLLPALTGLLAIGTEGSKIGPDIAGMVANNAAMRQLGEAYDAGRIGLVKYREEMARLGAEFDAFALLPPSTIIPGLTVKIPKDKKPKAAHEKKFAADVIDPYLKNLRSITEALLESWDPTIKAALGMEQLNQAWAHGLLSGDELTRGIQDLQAGLVDLDPIVKLHREEWRKAGEVWVQSQADLDAVAKSLKDSLQTPAEKATASFRELVLLLGTGRITPAQFTLATGKLEQGLSHAGELAHQLGTEMQSAFTQMIIYGRDFGDCLKSLIQLFAELILKKYVFESIAGGFSGSWIGSLFGGLAGMQAGGGVSAGTPYLVGEAGPELFVPGAAGSIVPMNNVGGDTYYSIDARGADPSVEPRLRRMLRELHGDAVERAQSQMRERAWRSGA